MLCVKSIEKRLENAYIHVVVTCHNVTVCRKISPSMHRMRMKTKYGGLSTIEKEEEGA